MNYKFNIPVVLIFFSRPDTFKQVFEKIRKQKPEKLFLIQDGPREGNKNDSIKIQQCREIAENIDWDCEVYKNYSDVNLGCGKRPSSGISWVFKYVDKAIILEDDCVPGNTFFPYCKELLKRYEHDERICYISGLNHFKEWDCGESSYFFTKTGAIWGWATWKRAWDKFDYYVKILNNEYTARLVKKQISNRHISKTRYQAWVKANKSFQTGKKLSYWDVQWGFVKYSENSLVIVPKYNQIHNIGIGKDSTHSQSLKKSSFRKYKNFVFIPVRPLEFPLKHPLCCICDTDYDSLLYKCISGNPIRNFLAKYIKKLIGKAKTLWKV